MIFWICGATALGAGLLACVLGDLRRAVLSLWVCSLAVGGLYLAMGAELLAIVQWIVSTLVAIAFIFYAVMFGEYVSRSTDEPAVPFGKKVLRALMPAVVGTGFAVVICFGAAHLPDSARVDFGPTAQVDGATLIAHDNVAAVGKALTENHFLSLEILGLTLFLVVVGSGVIARPEKVEARRSREASAAKEAT